MFLFTNCCCELALYKQNRTIHTLSITCAQCAAHLKVSALFINGNDEPIDISNELITLCLPEAISTLLQKLHQHLLNTNNYLIFRKDTKKWE